MQTPTGSTPPAVEQAERTRPPIDELRDVAHGIHPTVLTGGGLPPAIRRVAERSIVPVALVDVPSTRFDAIVEATAYCVFAKVLSAVQKHAHASSIRVRATAVRRTLQLELADGDGTRITATVPTALARSWLRTPWSSRC